MRVFAIAAILAVHAGHASAQSSLDYARMSAFTWSAFECAALASTAKLEDEQKRLFSKGLEQGRTFIEAVIAGKVENFDILQNAPVGFTMLMQGPSVDFVLGRVWEGALDNSHKEIYLQDDMPANSEITIMRAENLFRKKNCRLL